MERLWQSRLFEARKRELELMWKAAVRLEVMTLVANLGPILFASVTISLSAFWNGGLSPSVAFTAVNLFSNLHMTISWLPRRFAAINGWRISYRKIDDYLGVPEQARDAEEADVISLENACLVWPGQEGQPILRDVNLSFPRGALSVVVGKVGCGKSLLLSAILGVAEIQAGRLSKPKPPAQEPPPREFGASGCIVSGSTAYVSQPPWIEDKSIKDNILFGFPLDKPRYRQALGACSLTYDLQTLPGGDLTIAGEAGASLSGGQKWRVALARALYSPAEIIVLEDVLAAVDAPIARAICEKALREGIAEGRTIILATHRPEYCVGYASYVVTVGEGTAVESMPTSAGAETKEKWDLIEQDSTAEKKQRTATPTGDQKALSAPSDPAKANTQTTKAYVAPDYWQVLQVYIQTSPSLRWYLLGLLITITHRLLAASSTWWLGKLTSSTPSRPSPSSSPSISNSSTTMTISLRHDPSYDDTVIKILLFYQLLSVGSALFLIARALLFTYIGLDSSRLLFERLVNRILHAKMSWVDGNPSGQIEQTMYSDMYAINHRVAPQLIGVVGSVLHIVFISFSR
jgi:ABC-type multidrug transport system fused ATPase/permease subunit